jgi:predicted alpha/beta hydrolase family esterase
VNPVVLMVPGFTGSGPGHWQSFWEREEPAYRRVEQRDWDHPEPDEWVEALDRAVRAAAGPGAGAGGAQVVLVGHSLGCTTIAKWAGAREAGPVVAAMLVAPSDVEAGTAPPEVRCFAPIPLRPLPFPSLVVTSTDDPLVTFPRAGTFARSWGARLVSIGSAGHIHTAAGYGPWPEGHEMLRGLLRGEPGGR